MAFENSLRRLAIEAFRGFRDRQEFDLDASVIIISGANGTGKTSFFDALQWILSGRIRRLEDVRARRTVEHIVNQHRLSERAVVEAEVAFDGRALTLRRTGDRRGSSLELAEDGQEPIFGEEAEARLKETLLPRGDLSIETSLNTSGLLQQDVMRDVLEAKPAVRYDHMSSILGLTELEDFEEAVRAAAKAAQDQEKAARRERELVATSLAATRERLAELEDLQRVRPSVESILDRIRHTVAESAAKVVVELGTVTAERAQTLAYEASVMSDELSRIVQGLGDIAERRRSLDPNPTDDELAATAGSVLAAATASGEATSKLEEQEAVQAAAEQESEAIAKLAAAALPLLGTECPVCGHAIHEDALAQELRARSGGTQQLISAREAVAGTRSAVIERRSAESQARGLLSDLEQRRAAWESLRGEQETTSTRLAALVEESRPIRLAEVVVTEVAASIATLRELRSLFTHLYETLIEGRDSVDIARTRAEIAGLEDALTERDLLVEETANRALNLDALSETTVAARIDVTERRFNALLPLVERGLSRHACSRRISPRSRISWRWDQARRYAHSRLCCLTTRFNRWMTSTFSGSQTCADTFG